MMFAASPLVRLSSFRIEPSGRFPRLLLIAAFWLSVAGVRRHDAVLSKLKKLRDKRTTEERGVYLILWPPRNTLRAAYKSQPLKVSARVSAVMITLFLM